MGPYPELTPGTVRLVHPSISMTHSTRAPVELSGSVTVTVTVTAAVVTVQFPTNDLAEASKREGGSVEEGRGRGRRE